VTELAEVVKAYQETAASLLANPDDPEALTAQLTLLTARGDRTPAHLALAKRAAASAPDEFIAIFNLASAMMRACMPSREMFIRALGLASTDEQKHLVRHHLGLAHHEMGEFEVALRWYEMAGPGAEKSAAIAKLAMGRLKEGLYEFEVKHHIKPRKAISESGIPWWNGEDLEGRTVILTHEQGFGDTLQFIRFAPLLKKRCGRLICAAPESLAPLIAEQFDFFDDVLNEVGPFEGDYVTSPMAAAALMGIEYKDITGEPYMKAKPMKLPDRGKLKVGLSWKGSPGYARDHDRSAKLADLCSLLDVPGVAFYSLQVRPGPQEIQNLGLDGFIGDLGSLLGDWRDTARAISAMDLVIATDSANGHMAGALGKPVMLLLNETPCWRWMTGRSDTPWYKRHKLFRQAVPGDWATPVNAIRDELSRMVTH